MAKIYLIGMPGSGKTSLGNELANEKRLAFIDLDKIIEERENCSIPELFQTKGEAYFREVEAAVLKTHAFSDKSFVMATGGGAPCFHDSMNVILETGISIFLDVSPEELAARLNAADHANRPLLAQTEGEKLIEKLSLLRESRLEFYEQASVKIVSDSITVEDIEKLLV